VVVVVVDLLQSPAGVTILGHVVKNKKKYRKKAAHHVLFFLIVSRPSSSSFGVYNTKRKKE
jgi:hypothetical protein